MMVGRELRGVNMLIDSPRLSNIIYAEEFIYSSEEEKLRHIYQVMFDFYFELKCIITFCLKM